MIISKHGKALQAELDATTQLPYFEFRVVDKQGLDEWISCEYYFQGFSLISQRVAFTSKEERSSKIAITKIRVDDCFSLCEHLNELAEKLMDEIEAGDLFTFYRND